MVTNRIETLAGRRQIAQMIKDDPTEVVLRRREKEDVPGGGWRWVEPLDGTPIRSQTVKLIPFKRRMTQFLVSTELGPMADLPYVLLGYHDMDIQKDDLFTYDGGEFFVSTLDLSEPEIKVAAAIDYFGGGVNG